MDLVVLATDFKICLDTMTKEYGKLVNKIKKQFIIPKKP